MNKHIGSSFDDFCDSNIYPEKAKNKKMSEEEQTKDIIDEIRADAKRSIERLKDRIAEANEEALLVDGHDDALAGYDTQGRAVYLVENILETLRERDGMTHEEAVEFFDFNIAGAYVGEYTPIYIYEE
jgi:hypothetical protein